MFTVQQTTVFADWFKTVEVKARARIQARIDRMTQGNFGDAKPVGEGVSELRIDYGPGYRVYFKKTGREVVLLLCGGDKHTQKKDINRAKELAQSL